MPSVVGYYSKESLMTRLVHLVVFLTASAGVFVANAAHAAEVSSMLLRLVQQVEVPAREAGLLASVEVTEGQMVEEGQLLAQIDDNQARWEEEQVNLDVQIARVNAANEVNLSFARKSVDVARAELRRAEQSNLSFAKSVSESEMDRLRLVVERSVLAVEQAEHEQTIAGLTLQARESMARSAQERVERHKLPAPFSGIVVQIKRQRGEWVTPGEAVVRVVRIDRLRAEGYLSASDARPDLQGRPVRLRVDLPDGPGTIFPGKITFVDPEIDPVNAQTRIWVEVENTDLRLRPGMRASMKLDELTRPPTRSPKPQRDGES
ncbi:MAG: HlyD family efflux transporter periplasmic adaptor subunit [Planctomycetaceae bacterium]|nr:MAG: HlyD family efflux transporter periplasmic adaptor subunit [Planctomycetaceae bacterium]